MFYLNYLLDVFNLILSLNYNFKIQHVHILTQFTTSINLKFGLNNLNKWLIAKQRSRRKAE